MLRLGVVGHAGDHMQVQVQQQDQGDHGDLPGIHIAVDNMGDRIVPIAAATGGPTPTLTMTGPERRRHGMGHVVGDEIADDEALFSGMKISKRERRDLEQKKEVLKLVEARLKINDKYEGYQLPEDYITEQGKIDKKKKENALYKRYEDAKPKDDQFVTDVDQWEASQTQHSTFKMGAMDKKEIINEYEYVFDESQTIQFAMESSLPGATMTPAERLLQSQIDEAEKRGKLLNSLS